MKKINCLIYLCVGNPSVLEAQVLELLNYYNSNNTFPEVILLQGYKNKKEKIAIEKKLQPYPIKYIWFKYYPIYFLPSIFTIISLYKSLNRIIKDKKSYFLHIRSDMFGFFVKIIFGIKKWPLNILIDVRGIGTAGLTYKKRLSNTAYVRSYFKMKLIKFEYKHLFKQPYIHLSVVSPAIKKEFISKYNYPEKYITVNPNISGQQFKFDPLSRKNIRKEYGFRDSDLVAICSSNGGAKWQKDFEIIKHLVNIGIKVVNLSPHPVKIEGLINKIVPFQEMPKYLSAADIAILWRENDFMNEVASPSKFSEFASMGLFVIHNGSVDIAQKHIINTNAGTIIKQPEEITYEKLKNIDFSKRAYWSDAGISLFGIENIAENYVSKYNEIYNS
ncbi:hypothetical protein D1614_13575 [Maribellus luteus]|uniref:Glycosyltransferase n=1 Tax=Maribellus luteus TaxID=2305463 RepID=A0A399SUG0_9BACT|nr:hypothetical protein [Maribellus luteus]RIJ47610.1 hypothetical protein D1614_13575 [Maribellus luteus]